MCQEESIKSDHYLVKDMSLLLINRNIDDIIIVETDPYRVDNDLFSVFNPYPYDGSINYSQLAALK